MNNIVYNLIKTYASDYLYGFDRDQFDMNLLSGDIKLRVVNLKPDKINELLTENDVPFWIKSGMLTNVSSKLSAFRLIHEFTTKSLTSSKSQSDNTSIDIEVDEILLVLGTSRAHCSQYEDFEWDNNPEQTYVSIEEERRKISNKKLKEKQKKEREKKQTRDQKNLPAQSTASPPSAIKTAIELFMNLISINVNKIHIRFEDDYFTYYEKPLAFGLTLSSLNINSTNKEITFRNPLDLNYSEYTPEDDKNLFLKHILIQHVQVYWDPDAEMYVSHKLQDKTIAQDQKIFDNNAYDPEEYRVMMLLPFKDVQKRLKKGKMNRTVDQTFNFPYLINPFTIDVNMSYYRLKDEEVRKHPHHRFSLTALISTIKISLKPKILESIQRFMEYMQYQSLLPFLKRYKPRRRPLTSKRTLDPGLRAVRRQIVKDWFSYVIWANRVKRVLSNDICHEFHEEEVEQNKEKYDKALLRLRDPRDNELLDRHLGLDRGHEYNHLDKVVAPVIDEIYERKAKEQSQVNNEFFSKFLQKFFIVVKIQSVNLELYQSSTTVQYKQKDMPHLQVILGRTRLGVKIDNSRLNTQILLEDIKILDTLIQKVRGYGGGTTTVNETLNVKTGFFLDEDVTQFFRRHEDENSIFDQRNFDNPYSRVEQSRHLEPEEIIGGIRINEKPRLHNRNKNLTELYDEYNNHQASPENLIDFTGHGIQQEKENQQTSKYLFNHFWKKKIGSLIGMGGEDDDEESKQAKRGGNSNLLDAVTDTYQDDTGRNIFERCFFLAEGEPCFLELNLSVNMFKDPKDKQAINLNADIKNIRIEYANDLIKTLAETMYAFRGASAFGNIKIATDVNQVQRKIELWTPWYLVAQAFISTNFNPHYDVKGYNQEIKEENEAVAKENKKRAARKTQVSLANLDKQLKLLDLKLVITIQGLYFSLNTNYEKKKNLLQIKTEPIKAILIKQNNKFGLSVMGIQMMTQSSFELLFQFSQQMQKTLAIYLDNPVLTNAAKLYQDIINKRILESKRKHGGEGNLMNFDGSTIRPSGFGSDNFTFTEAPRFSAFGAGSLTYNQGRGTRKTLAPTPPRNKPTLDFNALKRPYDGRDTGRGYEVKDELQPAPIVKQLNEASFNDTDEEVSFSQRGVKSPSTKQSKKKFVSKKSPTAAVGASPVSFSPVKNENRHRVEEEVPIAQPRSGPSRVINPIENKAKSYIEPEVPLTQPRTGPSRVNRGQRPNQLYGRKSPDPYDPDRPKNRPFDYE